MNEQQSQILPFDSNSSNEWTDLQINKLKPIKAAKAKMPNTNERFLLDTAFEFLGEKIKYSHRDLSSQIEGVAYQVNDLATQVSNMQELMLTNDAIGELPIMKGLSAFLRQQGFHHASKE